MARDNAEEHAAGIASLLLDYARRVARHPSGRRAIVIHLSRLRPDSRRAHHIRIAANTFETLVKQFDGQLFLLPSADIVFICKDAGIADIDDAIMRLRYLFGEDPLAAALDEDGPDRFATWYDIERDQKAFLAFAESVHGVEMRRRKRIAAAAGAAPRGERHKLDAPALAELVSALARADLSNTLRRQPICALAEGAQPKPMLREIYVSIPDLRDSVLPRYELAADRWLFQYLTQALDKRVLALLRRNDDRAIAQSYSLNLNISTLLSEDFLQFDQSLRARARGTIVIELQEIDILADLGAYAFARDFLKERGYRICLDGVSPASLGLIDRARLGLDLVKVFWTPAMAEPQAGERATEFRAAVERIGKSRVILARCDSEAAVAFGRASGLRFFQGRHIDRLLSLTNAGAAGAHSPAH